MTKSLLEIERAEKIEATTCSASFNFYFERITLDNAPNEEGKTMG